MAICKINYPKRGIIMTDKFVTLAHGAGGKQTSELIDRVFKEHFANPDLTADDAAVSSMKGQDSIHHRRLYSFPI